MATTVISTDNLATTTSFNSANLTLIVNATLSANPALFLDTGASNASVVVNGSVIGAGAANAGLSSMRQVQLVNNGTISGLTGIVFNRSSNTLFFDEPSAITNFGLIRGGDGNGLAAIFDNLTSEGAASDQHVFNSGQIVGNIALRLGDGDSLTQNDGIIRGTGGVAILTGADEDIVRNNGTIYGDVTLGEGTNSLENSDLIDGSVSFGAGADSFDNSGTIRGDVDLGDGANSFDNSGRIDGDVSFGLQAEAIVNTGEIRGSITSVGGGDTITNFGLIRVAALVDSAIVLGADDDIVVNYGTIYGAVVLGSGDDLFDTSEGEFIGEARAGAGNDTVRGGDGADSIMGQADNDSLFGNGGNDQLFGDVGNDTLSGGVGADTLDGGTGSFGENDDVASYETATSAVIVSLLNPTINTGEAAGDVFIDIEGLMGSVYADTLTGDANRNNLFGGKGNDSLFGGAGNNDFLIGNDGDDFLDGGTGNDLLSGNDGSDTYIVDNAADFIFENSSLSGTDTAFIRVSYVLDAGAQVEILRADAGATGLSLTANTFAQLMIGGLGNDTLNGNGGTDSLTGGKGNDTYVLAASTTTTITELSTTGSGTDTITSTITRTLASFANVENLTLLGAAVVNATGNALANRLVGNSAANILNGSTGKDTLTGGSGADHFRFTTTLNASTNLDTITDFKHSEADKIDLDNAVMSALGSAGALASAKFFAAAGATHGHDADDRIIYNTTNGALYYDSNGSAAGGVTQIATLTGHPALVAGDFLII